MPLVYTRDEIKAYLADRGFDISDEQMIAKFIHDLKKMIKHEDRQRRRVKLGHDPQDTNLESTGHSINEVHSSAGTPTHHNQTHSDHVLNTRDSRRQLSNYQRPATASHSASVNDVSFSGHGVSSSVVDGNQQHEQKKPRRNQTDRGVADPQKNKLDSAAQTGAEMRSSVVQTSSHQMVSKRKSGSQMVSTKESKAQNTQRKSNQRHQRPSTASNRLVPSHATTNVTNEFNITDKSTHVSVDVRKSDRTSRKESKRSEATTGGSHNDTSELLYILGNLLGESEDDGTESGTTASSRKTMLGPPDSVKRDPVALYHYYKRIWDKQSFPGENRHMRLRWNVRAQTVGNYPCVDGQPVKYLR